MRGKWLIWPAAPMLPASGRVQPDGTGTAPDAGQAETEEPQTKSFKHKLPPKTPGREQPTPKGFSDAPQEDMQAPKRPVHSAAATPEAEQPVCTPPIARIEVLLHNQTAALELAG